ncbi:MAG TPA: 16S rRNA (cytosine(1402)-N(4))-methyltransferase RsmH [Candidatus Limnocylindrales bacterium]|nr:16S rRNA (cytosine(1402)-N(4))-methyltransferase RsmH [Candidatus Limnocylindrales bacterium]
MEDEKHIPVLLDEVLHYLDPQAGDTYLDLTAGYGGHAAKVLERTLEASQATLVDRDQNAIDYLSRQKALRSAEIIQKDFLSASKDLGDQKRRYKLILADLGVSSPHLDNASRGFSIRHNGPLDMRMDSRQELTADRIVNNYTEAELTKLLREYGEEPHSRAIAASIVANRPIADTHELAEIIARAVPRRRTHGPASKIHPATRSFQAIRLAVNDELGLLQAALPLWLGLLAPGGRIVVISFHSLEDRIVKQFFHEYSGDRYDAPLKRLTKRPIQASEKELAFNPRARSAKLRAAAKIKTIERES